MAGGNQHLGIVRGAQHGENLDQLAAGGAIERRPASVKARIANIPAVDGAFRSEIGA